MKTVSHERVFFVGDVATDEYYQAPYFPSIKEKIIVHALKPQMGGMIANAACVFASYGVPAQFMTALKPSENSRNLCAGLERAGLDTTHMVWDESLPESKTIVILAEDEHTVFIPTMGITRIDIPAETLEALRDADYVNSNFWEIAPLAAGDLSGLDLLLDLKAHGTKIWCDLDVAELGPGHQRLLSALDVVFVNEVGEKNLANHLGGDPITALHELGVRMVVVTRAEQGASVYMANHVPLEVEGWPVEVVDVTGAGDTFCSSFLYANLCSDDIELCARFANAAAARAVCGMGPRSGAVGATSVLDFMSQRGVDITPFQVFLRNE